MIGMILAGGYGKRLKPLTDEIPKPLIELKPNYSILDKQLFDFASAGIEKVILLTGHLSEKIEQRYGSSYKGLKLEYSIEEKPLGTLNAIRKGFELVDEDVMIRNGDIVADLNLRKMYRKFYESNFLASIYVTKMRSPYGIVELGENSIKSFKEKPLLDCYINGGVYCFRKEIKSLLSEFEGGEIEKTVFPILAESNQLGFYREDGLFWIAVDTQKDVEEVKKEYANRIDKPWGYEKILISTEKYLTKELFIREGYQTSFHYHTNKDETLFVIRGTGYVEFKDRKQSFSRNETIRIKPKIAHSIVASENTILHEVSTPHLEDTVRIKDFYSVREN